MDPKDIVIKMTLRFDQVNLMLSKLGACPFNEVADLISIIRQQTSASIEAVQQAAARPPANGADKGEEIAH